jgi:2-phospho-L-lactate guanylyltransferase (CobY/MobA/RfbA family)
MRLDNIPIAYLVTSTHLHMIVISSDILVLYEAVLIKRAIPASRHADYKNGSGTSWIFARSILSPIPDPTGYGFS